MMTRRSKGFSLIEILVAFTITTMALTLLFRIHANAATTIALAREYLQATELAHSVTDEVSMVEPELAFERHGIVDGRLRWTASAREAPGAANSNDASPQRKLVLREVKVVVEWKDGAKERQIELSSVRPYPPVEETDP